MCIPELYVCRKKKYAELETVQTDTGVSLPQLNSSPQLVNAIYDALAPKIESKVSPSDTPR